MQGAGRCFSLFLPARGLGEAGFRVCGYMGLDSMGSSLMETQKLSFEEQPDAKVKPVAPWGCEDPPHAGAGLSPASPHTLGCHTLPTLGCHTLPILWMSQFFLPSHNSPLPLCQPVVACALIQADQISPSFPGNIFSALWLPKSVQLPQPWFLLLMSSTDACHKMKAWFFICR